MLLCSITVITNYYISSANSQLGCKSHGVKYEDCEWFYENPLNSRSDDDSIEVEGARVVLFYIVQCLIMTLHSISR